MEFFVCNNIGDVHLAEPNLAIVKKLTKWMENITKCYRANFKLKL